TGECILAHCEPDQPGANAGGCVSDPVNEGDVCTDDGYGCTDDRCTSGACRHTPVAARCPSDEPCLPIICAPAQAAPEPTGCVPGMVSAFDLVARMLAGKAQGPLAPVHGGKGVPSSLETPAQRRGRMALAQLQETPKKVAAFLRGLTPARRQGLLGRTTVK